MLGLTARNRPDPMKAFTLSFGESVLYDESAIAREMAQKAGTEFHVIPSRRRIWPTRSRMRSSRPKAQP
jgi:hypothetical protein